MYYSRDSKYTLDKDDIYKYFVRNLLESFRYGKADLIWNRACYLTTIYGAAYGDMDDYSTKIICPLAGLYRAMYVTKVAPDIALDMLDVYVEENADFIYKSAHSLKNKIAGTFKHPLSSDIASVCNQIGEPELAPVAIKIYDLLAG
ncbi:MAG: hypothetical protein K6B67_07675 [Lachnospiraceae bacterium]|nr:hypothetical protein [Lachnospiraceae bacterium]